MIKKIYETPEIDILTFESSDDINLNTSSVQLKYKNTSVKDINNVNAIDF